MAVVFFDGVCNLCNGVVRFVIERDPHARIQFAPLTSRAAGRVLDGLPVPPPDSVVVLDEGRVFTRSDAALRIARLLGFPWSLAGALKIVPRRARDAIYDAIARRRYRWFGRQETCMVPGPEIKARFLD